jgi:hypothetical protein
MAGGDERIVEELTGIPESDDAVLRATGGEPRTFDRVLAERDVDPAQVDVVAQAYARWRECGDAGRRVRGALGFWLMTMLMVRWISGAASGDSPEETWPSLQRRLNQLFVDPDVRGCFSSIYRPYAGLDLSDASVHRLGTTSFILRCVRNDNTRDAIALKCLLYPYIRNRRITEATQQYATNYGPVDAGARAHMPRVLASGRRWIAMDFIEGRTLEEVLEDLPPKEGRRQGVPIDAIRRYGLPLLTALADVQMAHLDLTPSNIIACESAAGGDGSAPTVHVHLVDFGRNYLLSHDVGSGGMGARQALFVAPELLHGRGSARSGMEDVFSVGQILLALAGFGSGYGGFLPTKLYEEAPFLAPIVEDLIDLEPGRRLLLAGDMALDLAPEAHRVMFHDIRDRLRDAIDAQEKLATMSPTLDGSAVAGGLFARLASMLGSVTFLAGPVRRPLEFARVAGLFQRSRVGNETVDLYRYLFWFVFACSIGWYCMLAVVGGDLVYRFVGSSLAPDLHDAIRAGWPPIDVRAVQAQYASLSAHTVDWYGVLVRLVVLSFGATAVRYYLDIFAPLTVRPLRVTPGRRMAEFVMRLTEVGAAPLVLVLYLWFLNDWLIGFSVATAWIALNNRLSWRLASRLSDRGERELSTVAKSDLSQSLGVFSQWWWLMACYSAMLLAFGIAARGSLHGFTWALAVMVIVLNILKLYRSNCGKLAPGVRASLHRAFITGQRLEELDRRPDGARRTVL